MSNFLIRCKILLLDISCTYFEMICQKIMYIFCIQEFQNLDELNTKKLNPEMMVKLLKK